MKSKLLQMRAELVAARAQRTLVRVERSVERGWANGYVVDVGPHFFALLVVSDLIVFNGFQAFRIRDLTALQAPAPSAAFVERAMRLRGAAAPPNPPLDLGDLPSLLTSASSAFPLVTVHREIDDPDVCHIGTVQAILDGMVTLRTIDPDGEWDDESQAFALSEITRVDCGGLYEEALSLVEHSNRSRDE